MTIIFLDIDGVLNSASSYWKYEPKGVLGIYPENTEALDWFMDKVPEAKIVLSSTWRFHYDLKEIRRLLVAGGLSRKNAAKVISYTPDLWRTSGNTRGKEIQTWLDEAAREVKSFVILDDNNIDAPDSLEKNFIKTDSRFGLCHHDARQAIAILNDEEPPVLFF